MSSRGRSASVSASARKSSPARARSAPARRNNRPKCLPHGIHWINGTRVNLNYVREILGPYINFPNTNSLLETIPFNKAVSILKYILKCRMDARGGRLNKATRTHKLEIARIMRALLKITTGRIHDPRLFIYEKTRAGNNTARLGNRATVEAILHL
jgi:hypothetical protein